MVLDNLTLQMSELLVKLINKKKFLKSQYLVCRILIKSWEPYVSKHLLYCFIFYEFPLTILINCKCNFVNEDLGEDLRVKILVTPLSRQPTSILRQNESRDRNSAWLSAKAGSSFHWACSVGMKVSEKSQLKINYFCKMIVLFLILKRLSTVAMMKL